MGALEPHFQHNPLLNLNQRPQEVIVIESKAFVIARGNEDFAISSRGLSEATMLEITKNLLLNNVKEQEFSTVEEIKDYVKTIKTIPAEDRKEIEKLRSANFILSAITPPPPTFHREPNKAPPPTLPGYSNFAKSLPKASRKQVSTPANQPSIVIKTKALIIARGEQAFSISSTGLRDAWMVAIAKKFIKNFVKDIDLTTDETKKYVKSVETISPEECQEIENLRNANFVLKAVPHTSTPSYELRKPTEPHSAPLKKALPEQVRAATPPPPSYEPRKPTEQTHPAPLKKASPEQVRAAKPRHGPGIPDYHHNLEAPPSSILGERLAIPPKKATHGQARAATPPPIPANLENERKERMAKLKEKLSEGETI